jgi:hypothetical protein
MGEITKKVNETVEGDIRYLKERIEKTERCWSLATEVAERLEESFQPEEVRFYGSRFTFGCESSKEAYQIVKKLLHLFPEIERFSKDFQGGYLDPKWNWTAGISREDASVVFVIENATPEENCIPIQRTHSYTTWECQKR